MGAVGAYSAYATDIVAVQRVYYNQVYNFSCEFPVVVNAVLGQICPLTILLDQWMLVMSTQLIGFAIGGIMRRFLVQPPSMSKRRDLSNRISVEAYHP